MRSFTPLLLAALVSAERSFAQEATVTPSLRVNVGGFNPSGANAIDGATVVSAGNGVFHAAWVDQFGTTSSRQDIYFATSTDNGATFSAPVRVDLGDLQNEFDSDQLHMAVTDSGVIVVLWEEKRDAATFGTTSAERGTEDLYYNRSTDGGATWMAAALPLNTATAGANVASDIDRAWIEADGETFHVTWEEDTATALNGNEEVWYTRSTDAGATWSTPVILNANPGVLDVDDPKVVADGGTVIVYWVEDNGAATTSDDIVIVRSTDGGATFGLPTVIESDLSGNVDDTLAAMDGQLVSIAYNENFPGDPAGEGVVAIVSTDGGATWLPEVVISAQMYAVTNADADVPSVAVHGDSVYIVYDEDSRDRLAGGTGDSGGNVCYLAYTNDRGATWNVDVDIENGRISNRPRIVANDEVVVIYKEYNANGANVPVFGWSTDAGATWSNFAQVPGAGPDVDEGNGANESRYLALDASSNVAVAVYMDNQPTGANEVYSSSVRVALPVGVAYCSAVANSTGFPGSLRAQGNVRAAENALTLVAESLPVGTVGFFLTSTTEGFVPGVQGGAGNLCLGGNIGRGVGGAIVTSDANGSARIAADLAALPQPSGAVAALAGETWSFQFWHRDLIAQVATTSNLTNGVRVTFE